MSASSPPPTNYSSASSDAVPKDATKLALENQSLKRRLVQYAATLEKLTGHARREIDASVRARDDALAAAADAAVLREAIADVERNKANLEYTLTTVEQTLKEKETKLVEMEGKITAMEKNSLEREKDLVELAELKLEVTATKREAELAREERKEERERAERLHEEVVDLGRQLTDANQVEMRVRELELEKLDAEKARDTAHALLDEVKGKEQTVRTERDLFQKKTQHGDTALNNLKNDLAAALEKTANLEQALRTAKSQGMDKISSAEMKAKQADDTCTALRAELDEANAQLSDTKTSLEEIRLASMAQQVHTEAVEERDVLKDNLATIQDELEQSNELLTRAAIDALADKQRIRKLEDSLYKVRASLNTEREERRVKDQKISQLTQTIQSADHELDELRSAKRMLSDDCHKLQLEIHEHTSAVATKSRELEELGAVRADRESAALKLSLELSNSKNALAKKESDMGNIAAEYQDVCNQLDVASKDLESRHVDLAAMRRELGAYKDQVVDLETEAERNKLTLSELQSARRQVQDLTERGVEKDADITEITRQFTATKNECSSALREKKRLSDMLGEVSGDLKRANQELHILRGLRKDNEMLAARIGEMSAHSTRELDIMKRTQTEQAQALAKNTVQEYQRRLEEVQLTAHRDIAETVTNQLRNDLMPHLLSIVDSKAKTIVRNLAKHVESFAIDVATDSDLSNSKHAETGAATDVTSRSPSQYVDNSYPILPQPTNQANGSDSQSPSDSAVRTGVSECADTSCEARGVRDGDLALGSSYPGDEGLDDDDGQDILARKQQIPGDNDEADDTVDATEPEIEAVGVMSSDVFVMMTSDDPDTEDAQVILEGIYGAPEYDEEDMRQHSDEDYDPGDDVVVGEYEEEFEQCEEREIDITGLGTPVPEDAFPTDSGNEPAEDEVTPTEGVASEAVKISREVPESMTDVTTMEDEQPALADALEKAEAFVPKDDEEKTFADAMKAVEELMGKMDQDTAGPSSEVVRAPEELMEDTSAATLKLAEEPVPAAYPMIDIDPTYILQPESDSKEADIGETAVKLDQDTSLEYKEENVVDAEGAQVGEEAIAEATDVDRAITVDLHPVEELKADMPANVDMPGTSILQAEVREIAAEEQVVTDALSIPEVPDVSDNLKTEDEASASTVDVQVPDGQEDVADYAGGSEVPDVGEATDFSVMDRETAGVDPAILLEGEADAEPEATESSREFDSMEVDQKQFESPVEPVLVEELTTEQSEVEVEESKEEEVPAAAVTSLEIPTEPVAVDEPTTEQGEVSDGEVIEEEVPAAAVTSLEIPSEPVATDEPTTEQGEVEGEESKGEEVPAAAVRSVEIPSEPVATDEPTTEQGEVEGEESTLEEVPAAAVRSVEIPSEPVATDEPTTEQGEVSDEDIEEEEVPAAAMRSVEIPTEPVTVDELTTEQGEVEGEESKGEEVPAAAVTSLEVPTEPVAVDELTTEQGEVEGEESKGEDVPAVAVTSLETPSEPVAVDELTTEQGEVEGEEVEEEKVSAAAVTRFEIPSEPVAMDEPTTEQGEVSDEEVEEEEVPAAAVRSVEMPTEPVATDELIIEQGEEVEEEEVPAAAVRSVEMPTEPVATDQPTTEQGEVSDGEVEEEEVPAATMTSLEIPSEPVAVDELTTEQGEVEGEESKGEEVPAAAVTSLEVPTEPVAVDELTTEQGEVEGEESKGEDVPAAAVTSLETPSEPVAVDKLTTEQGEVEVEEDEEEEVPAAAVTSFEIPSEPVATDELTTEQGEVEGEESKGEDVPAAAVRSVEMLTEPVATDEPTTEQGEVSDGEVEEEEVPAAAVTSLEVPTEPVAVDELTTEQGEVEGEESKGEEVPAVAVTSLETPTEPVAVEELTTAHGEAVDEESTLEGVSAAAVETPDKLLEAGGEKMPVESLLITDDSPDVEVSSTDERKEVIVVDDAITVDAEEADSPIEMTSSGHLDIVRDAAEQVEEPSEEIGVRAAEITADTVVEDGAAVANRGLPKEIAFIATEEVVSESEFEIAEVHARGGNDEEATTEVTSEDASEVEQVMGNVVIEEVATVEDFIPEKPTPDEDSDIASLGMSNDKDVDVEKPAPELEILQHEDTVPETTEALPDEGTVVEPEGPFEMEPTELGIDTDLALESVEQSQNAKAVELVEPENLAGGDVPLEAADVSTPTQLEMGGQTAVQAAKLGAGVLTAAAIVGLMESTAERESMPSAKVTPAPNTVLEIATTEEESTQPFRVEPEVEVGFGMDEEKDDLDIEVTPQAVAGHANFSTVEEEDTQPFEAEDAVLPEVEMETGKKGLVETELEQDGGVEQDKGTDPGVAALEEDITGAELAAEQQEMITAEAFVEGGGVGTGAAVEDTFFPEAGMETEQELIGTEHATKPEMLPEVEAEQETKVVADRGMVDDTAVDAVPKASPEASPEAEVVQEVLVETNVVAEVEVLATTKVASEPEVLTTTEVASEPEVLTTTEVASEPEVLATTEVASEPGVDAGTEFIAKPKELPTAEVPAGQPVIVEDEVPVETNVEGRAEAVVPTEAGKKPEFVESEKVAVIKVAVETEEIAEVKKFAEDKELAVVEIAPEVEDASGIEVVAGGEAEGAAGTDVSAEEEALAETEADSKEKALGTVRATEQEVPTEVGVTDREAIAETKVVADVELVAETVVDAEPVAQAEKDAVVKHVTDVVPETAVESAAQAEEDAVRHVADVVPETAVESAAQAEEDAVKHVADVVPETAVERKESAEPDASAETQVDDAATNLATADQAVVTEAEPILVQEVVAQMELAISEEVEAADKTAGETEGGTVEVNVDATDSEGDSTAAEAGDIETTEYTALDTAEAVTRTEGVLTAEVSVDSTLPEVAMATEPEATIQPGTVDGGGDAITEEGGFAVEGKVVQPDGGSAEEEVTNITEGHDGKVEGCCVEEVSKDGQEAGAVEVAEGSIEAVLVKETSKVDYPVVESMELDEADVSNAEAVYEDGCGEVDDTEATGADGVDGKCGAIDAVVVSQSQADPVEEPCEEPDIVHEREVIGLPVSAEPPIINDSSEAMKGAEASTAMAMQSENVTLAETIEQTGGTAEENEQCKTVEQVLIGEQLLTIEVHDAVPSEVFIETAGQDEPGIVTEELVEQGLKVVGEGLEVRPATEVVEQVGGSMGEGMQVERAG